MAITNAKSSHRENAPPQRVVAIIGPTASGKSGLAEQIARERPCEIVSIDSALVYREMNIGTAKPSLQIRQEIPHHLIDIREPSQAFSAAEFVSAAHEAISDIHRRGKLPLLVGGTLLYLRALLNGLAPMPAASEEVRDALSIELARDGLESMHRRLSTIDPEAAARIHPNDPQRVQRALEVFEITGKPMSELWRVGEQYVFPYPLIRVVLWLPERAKLHQRIARRLDEMFARGFVGEVARLRARGDVTADLPSMRSVGYRQIWQHLDGEFDEATMRERVLYATRQLAKRQMTWLRQHKTAHWIEADREDLCERALKLLDVGPY